MEQVLYKLPDGWEWHSVKKLSHNIQYGHTAKAESNGNAKFLRITDIQDGKIDWQGVPTVSLEKKEINKYALNDDDLIFARSGATAGKSILIKNAPKDAVFASYLIRIVPNKKYIIPEYLSYFFLTPAYWEVVGQNAAGAAQPNINGTKLSEFIVPVAPQGEQKRIVEKLGALLTRIDTAIEHLQESVTLADALSQNGLDVYFAELTETNPELTLSKLADFISGYAFKSGDFKSESGIKPIKITNVGVNEFSENAEEFLPASYETEYQRFAAKTNDIVIALTRPIINGGLKVCRVPEAYSGALVNQRVAAITSHNKHVLDFIYLYLQSSRTKNYVLEKSKSLNQPNLSITDLKNLTLPLPVNDEAIAKAVADCNALISKARKSKAEISEKITMMQQLKASILDSAFKGEL
ncbi:restriction endonuclease subunit S [Providencia zhijiangensis]|jgi:type I restriction enzyme, S subunit|uniref:Restriction endonuclease subunit S n=1 Tax=Providencia zhijiangensis TaxID=3053982 RepID=A0ABZ0N2X5_9GAMM|nr:restriction endonuclease subunit S [Providencia sp. D4759]WPA92191.1 restriction endonuclease subunit S [Providencia sp. D4759]